MNVTHLRYFNAVATHGSYAKAARHLFVAQSTLSSSIKALEREIGFDLLERKGRGIVLTPQGKHFAQRVDAALAEIDAGIIEGRQETKQQSNLIRLGIFTKDQVRYISSAMREFKRDLFPNVHFKMMLCENETLLEDLADNKIDIALVMEEESPGFYSSPALKGSLLACVSPFCDLAKQERISIQDLKKHSLLTYHPQTPMGEPMQRWLAENGLNAATDYEDEASLVDMVRVNTTPLALVVVSTSWNEATLRGIKAIPVKTESHTFWMYAAMRKDQLQGSTPAMFCEYLKKRADRAEKSIRTRMQGQAH